MLAFLFVVALAKTVTLQQEPFELALSGDLIKLNITSLSGLPVDVRLFAKGEVYKYRHVSIETTGEYEWMIIDGKGNNNEIKVKWKRVPISYWEEFVDYVGWAVLILRILSIFKIRHTQAFFQLFCLALALVATGKGKIAERLIHLWAAK